MRDPVKVRASQLIEMLDAEKIKIQEINHFLWCLIDVLKNYRDTKKDPVVLVIPADRADTDDNGNPDPCCGWCIDNVPPPRMSGNRTSRSSRKPSGKR
jgi:hypothetical protein